MISLVLLASGPLQAKPPAIAQLTAALESSDGWPEVYVEISRPAPGRQEAFIRDTIKLDSIADRPVHIGMSNGPRCSG